MDLQTAIALLVLVGLLAAVAWFYHKSTTLESENLALDEERRRAEQVAASEAERRRELERTAAKRWLNEHQARLEEAKKATAEQAAEALRGIARKRKPKQ